MELAITTDLTVLPKTIDFNFSEIKHELEIRLEKYNNLVVTEESIRDAKTDKATLNKLKTALEDKRKEVKKICLLPYDDFEKHIKELVNLINAPVIAIDKQVKEFDEIRKQQKYAELLECFNTNVKELADFVTLDKIINPKWQNVSQSVESLKGEICDRLDRIRDDIKFITEIYGDKPYKEAVYQEYFKNLSREKTMAYALILEKKSEMQNKVIESVSKKETVAESVATEAKKTVSENVEIKEDVSIGKARFEVSCTRSQLIELREFMKKTGIEFKVIR